mmetsp:Transcript_86310/g.217511  ORF Transcript_86310/g.217511 Transcript_86310/m.217511 type:complete len:840 (+) Transcript_86310:76-2595(+)
MARRCCYELSTNPWQDLRFSCAENEVAFKASIENQLLRPLIIAAFLGKLGVLASFVPNYMAERSRSDSPFQWELMDPRFLFFAVSGFTMILALLVNILAIARLVYGLFSSWSWEHIAAGVGVYVTCALFLLSSWHSSRLVGADPEKVWMHETRSSEMLTILSLVAQVMAVCMYMPIRVCILWIVPACASLVYIVVIALVGSPFPASMYKIALGLPAMCFFCYQGARRHERHIREKWLAMQRIEEQDTELEDRASLARAFHEVAGTLCDIVVILRPDLTITDADTTHQAFFGQAINGHPFSGMLIEADRPRFEKALQEASESQSLQSLPASLDLPFATLCVQLVLVDTRGGNKRYLVGLHSVESSPRHHSEVRSDHLARIEEENSTEPDEEQETRMSLNSTTFTGHVFSDLEQVNLDGNSGVLRTHLEHIADVGCREHWLIGTAEVELLPNRVLGMGSYGVVVAARLRGTTVAAKVPKQPASSLNIRHLASIANELRINRHIRHRNIVPLYGACIDPGSGQIVLLYELICGMRLDMYVHQLVDSSKHPRHQLLLDIASALCYLHSLKPAIVHGDLKPSNIVVESFSTRPRAKLLDFGLSRILTKKAKPLGGTVQWMAPELLSNTHIPMTPLPSADVFSFGLICYFVVRGVEPLKNISSCRGRTSAGKRHSRHLSLAWPPGGAFREECSQLCEACLTMEPGHRPSMPTTQQMLLTWLPIDPVELQAFGPEVLLLVVPGKSWVDGLQVLQSRLEQEQQQQLRQQTQLGMLQAQQQQQQPQQGQLEPVPYKDSDELTESDDIDGMPPASSSSEELLLPRSTPQEGDKCELAPAATLTSLRVSL